MSNPFEEMFGTRKKNQLHTNCVTITHWNALEFDKKLNAHMATLTDPANVRKGGYNRTAEIKYAVCPKADGMQYTALVVEEWMTDLPEDEDEDEDDEPRQTEGPMIHPMNMMFNARKVD
jgi:hypothetical protein